MELRKKKEEKKLSQLEGLSEKKKRETGNERSQPRLVEFIPPRPQTNMSRGKT